MKKHTLIIPALLLISFFYPLHKGFATNGYLVHGVGAVNESLGGAGVGGNAQDVLGSLYRNPANGLVFDGTKGAFGFGLVFPEVTLKSSVAALGMSGSSDSKVDMIPALSFGKVYRDKDASRAYYFALIPEAGLKLKLEESLTNPLLLPQADKPNNPFGGLFGGFGEIETELELVRFPLGAAYQLNPKLRGGFSVAPSVQRMKFSPAAFADPDDANGNAIPSYPKVEDFDTVLGLGFQAGLGYRVNEACEIGFTLTTPTWMEKQEWDVKDEVGNKRKVSFRLNRPPSVRLGGNYQVTEKTMVLMDAEWINYSDTAGFDKTGISPTGALLGLGWDDVWVLAMGLQHKVNNALVLRSGYNYCTNPIEEENTFFNVGSALHIQEHWSCGGSYRVSNNTFLDFGYTHAPESSQKGPFYTADGPVPGTEVETRVKYDHISISTTISF